METDITFAERALQFYTWLANEKIKLPDGYRIINPFVGSDSERVQKVLNVFYRKYYSDTNSRRLILGSSPARRGSALTGVPFEEADRLKEITGIELNGFHLNKSSSSFLYEVIEEYGGFDIFYSKFYMNFVCPFGISKITPKGTEINSNYYENKALRDALYNLIVRSIRAQMECGIDSDICYCIGSGANFNFLSRVNDQYHFFNKIIPLEHPRFITQYNSGKKDEYKRKYLNAFEV